MNTIDVEYWDENNAWVDLHCQHKAASIYASRPAADKTLQGSYVCIVTEREVLHMTPRVARSLAIALADAAKAVEKLNNLAAE